MCGLRGDVRPTRLKQIAPRLLGLMEWRPGAGRDRAVDVAEAADGDHDDELDAENDGERLGRDDEEREGEQTSAETGGRGRKACK